MLFIRKGEEHRNVVLQGLNLSGHNSLEAKNDVYFFAT